MTPGSLVGSNKDHAHKIYFEWRGGGGGVYGRRRSEGGVCGGRQSDSGSFGRPAHGNQRERMGSLWVCYSDPV